MKEDHTLTGPVALGKKLEGDAYDASVPYDADRVGAAAVYCSDGRYGDQMDEFLHQALGLPRYDRVAVPGGGACLASHIVALREAGALEKQLRFLVEAHALKRIVLIAHQDCGFYKQIRLKAPLETQQFEDLRVVATKLRQLMPQATVDAYFARKVEGFVRFELVPT